MTTSQQTPDITVRGGLINVPPPRTPNQPPRHQPNTPPTKKPTKVRSDHQVPPTAPQKTTSEPTPKPATPEVPAEPEPETDSEE